MKKAMMMTTPTVTPGLRMMDQTKRKTLKMRMMFIMIKDMIGYRAKPWPIRKK